MPRGRGVSLLAVCLILVMSSVVWIYPVQVRTVERGQGTTIVRTLSSYTQHGPIDIRNDTALAFYAVSGTGDPGTPYVLEGWNITTEDGHGITISDTTKHFVVRDCWLSGTRDDVARGIRISHAGSGTTVVERIHCEGWYIGIEVISTTETVVKGCSITDCDGGLNMNSAINSTVFNNTVYQNNGWGMWLASHSSTVANNTLWGNVHGLGIFYGNDSVVENNTLVDDGFSFVLDSVAIYETLTEKNNLVNGLPLLFIINEVGTSYDGGVGQAILINCTNVLLSNMDLSHCETGAFLRWCVDCRISDSISDYNDDSGFDVSYSYNIGIAKTSASWNALSGFKLVQSTVNITNCDIIENQRGVDLPSTEGEVSIHSNNFVNNTEYGVMLRSQWNLSVTDNTFTEDGVYCVGNSIEEYGRYVKNVTGNVVNGKPLAFYHSLQDAIISSPHGQIFLANCSNVVITSLDCSNTVMGIGIGFSADCSIINSDCSHAKQSGIWITYSNFTLVQNVVCDYSRGTGIRVYDTQGASLVDNHCTNNWVGIDFHFSREGLVRGNIITHNQGSGLRVTDSMYVNILDNICDFNQQNGIYVDTANNLIIYNNTCNYCHADGIYISDSFELLVHSNDCRSNSWSGMYLDFSWSGILASNRLQDNVAYGLRLQGGNEYQVYWNSIFSNGLDGVYCLIWNSLFMHNTIALNDGYAAYLFHCNNVSVHHNYFVSNNNGGCQVFDESEYTNLWYDTVTVEGNYYSDWIGHGAYFIDGGSEAYDLYPLGEIDSDSDSLWDSWEIAHGLNPHSSDSDSDSLPDAWEVMYGLDPLVDDASGDLDEDGVSNLEEFMLGLNPASEDSDEDLMPDLWELQNYLNPLFNDANLDPDGDGVSNIDEYLGGTSPHVYNAPSTTTSTTTPTTPTTSAEVLDIMVPVLISGGAGFVLAILFVFLIQRKRTS